MAFRKRNIALSRPGDGQKNPDSPSSPSAAAPAPPTPGVRPSPIDGRPTISTGSPSLDGILAGHAGLPLGNSILIEESGTTDYAGALLRFYAAEGVVQGHRVHVVGMGEGWGRELPGLSESRDEVKRAESEKMKMKIAWRYEGLGKFDNARGAPAPNRGGVVVVQAQSGDGGEGGPAVFCHVFDLAKRLALPVGGAVNYIYIPRSGGVAPSPFVLILRNIQRQLAASAPGSVHRVVIPSLLSPALYPSDCARPESILQFLHALRALLRQYPTRLTAISTLPLSLYPRSTGLVRWMEIFSDGVIELSPFPYDPSQALSTSGATTQQEERPQGMLAVHKLPVFHERGGGGSMEGLGEDLAFTLSRRKFVIAKFSLPPVEGDHEAQEAAAQSAGGKMPSKKELEF
ncbi:PAXNEB-domain-containing protein [Amniculicola lignicola CBS 123094]|uniref:Elongator complex protein 4 n=1 Tax=Amniculicola lignicola CBS 123094 TaxID=1392246 RepID=A0A6A5VUA5_9PLEO|nr:PAXNEB-domain-containing protein [Amniculicola lignicola CBS 123094]